MIRRTTNPQRRPKPEPEVRNSRKRAQATTLSSAHTPARTPARATAPAPLNESKAALVTRLLGRPGGATLDELTKATSWQPHTVRAALTGLRKKGHTIVRDSINGASRYSLIRGASAPKAKTAAPKKGAR